MEDAARVEKYRKVAGELLENIEANAWDGSWYRRAYFDNGAILGSAKNSECKIDSIAQSWSVISGMAKPGRMTEAMDAVQKYLVNREEGLIKLLTPPFDKGDLQPGYIKAYVPGVRENGGQYTHAAVWVVLAFCMLRNGDRAGELFHMLNPINHTRTKIEYSIYKAEPYVIAADIYGEPPHAGRGGWSWYTGAAGWLYRVGIENIIGFVKKGDKLFLNPCVPKSWSKFEIEYHYGGSVYHITVKNPHKICSGRVKLTIDEVPSEQEYINLHDDGKHHYADVLLCVPNDPPKSDGSGSDAPI
jgi:cellobiose phosphorylase